MYNSISCVSDSDCPNTLPCKNNYCQYPVYYCIGNDTCIAENKSNNVLYSIQNNSQPEEKELNHVQSLSSLIIESCHPNDDNCHTKPCYKNSDCFSNHCEINTNRCLLNKELPIYSCINKEQEGGMVCGKNLEEECEMNEECLTQYCDTQLHICNHANKNITIDDDNDDEFQNNETENHSMIIKEILILIFFIIPMIVFTQYLKTTKYVKNIKRNRQTFEYKKILVEDLSNC